MSKCPLGYSNILAWLIKEHHRIGALKLSTEKKNERIQKAAIQATANLWVKVANTKPVKEEDKYHEPKDEQVTATTHNRYVTKLRRDLEESGLFDYDFEKELDALIKAYPKSKSALLNIKADTYKQASKARGELIVTLEASLKRSKREATVNELKKLIENLSSLKIEPFFYVALTRTKQERRNMNHRESDRKTKYQKRPRKFSGMDMIELIYRLIKTEKPENLAIACAMSCGRRCSEVLHFGEFEKFNDTRLTFKGMRKSKVKATETFKIPVIIEPELFLEALDKLRNSDFIKPLVDRLIKQEKLHEGALALRINGTVSGRLNEQINFEMNLGKEADEVVKWTFKDTRAIYARLSYAIYCANMKKAGKDPVQEVQYFKNTLLHTDHNETLNYLQFRITDADALTAYNIKKAKEAADKLEFVPQHELIKPLLKDEKVMSNRTMARVVSALVDWLKSNGEQVIDTPFLRKTFGGKSAALSELLGHIKALNAHEPRLVVKEVAKTTKKMITKQIEVVTTYTFTKREFVDVQLKEGATDDRWEEALQNAANSSLDESYFESFDAHDADDTEMTWEVVEEWDEDVNDE